MSIDAIKKALEADANGAEHLAELDALLKAKNNEAAQARVARKTEMEKAVAATSKLNALLEKLGIEPDADDYDSALEKIRKPKSDAGAGGGGGSAELSELHRSVEQLKRQFVTADKDKQAALKMAASEREKRHGVISRHAVYEALVAGKAVDPETLVGIFLSRVKVDGDDEKPVYVADDGTTVDVPSGVESFLKLKPHFRANDGKPGAGSGGGGQPGAKVPVYGEPDYPAWMAANAADIASGKVKID